MSHSSHGNAVLLLLVGALTAAASVPLGCGGSEPARANAPRPRIVSFSPALTQILFDLGLGDHVVGITTYCNPPAGQERPVVGDRARVSVEAILAVQPDLILIQQNPDDFRAVRKVDPDIRVEHFRIERVDEVAAAIERIGRLAGRPELARERRERFEQRLDAVRRRVTGLDRPRTLFLMGFDRLSAPGEGTFIEDMIELAGGISAAAEKYDRWANISNEGVIALEPEVLICQVSVGQEAVALKHWGKLDQLPAVRNDRVFVVTEDGWTIPSTRSADFIERMAEMIHPELPGEPAP